MFQWLLKGLRRIFVRPVRKDYPLKGTAFLENATFIPDPMLMESWINKMGKIIHKDNEFWWRDLETGEWQARNVGEMLMLCVSELAEALEGHRKNLMDTHLTDQKMFDVELADVYIRLMDIAYGMNVNLGKMVRLKLEYNRNRPDHQPENRKQANGKKY